MGNSSSTASSSTTTTTNGEQYDVFLSFRGEDTRHGFTSHLYHALHEKQIKTFIDNQLKRGEEISEGLWSAIGESKISVIIFSEKYASSKWCLHELVEIMKYREMKKQIVIPVFYKVDPSHVRKQIGSYEAVFAKHELQQVDEVKKWREALTEASNISGWDSSETRNESEFVHSIVRDVWNKLYNISPSYDFPGLVGIYKHIERVVSLLCLGVPDFRIIGICGMGGIGKTTVADAIFQLISHKFENPYFAHCVRAETEKNSSGLIRLRNKIISKVLNDNNLQLCSPSIDPLIKRRLNQKKVLIVLDDVDESTNFGILTGGLDRFGPGSRIILTTRDKQVLRNCRVEDHNMYEVEELNDDESLHLFYNCAFMQNHPEDLKVLSRKVVKIAKNLPLAVIVLGSSLYKKSKQDWENAVDKFQRNVHHRVLDVLKISYDGLDEEEKGLFLDIACFPLFGWIDDFGPILLSDREFSLSTLIDKSLVTMENGRIGMHDLLREMAWEIASKNHSRLWRQEDIIRTLKHNDGIANTVQGISLYVDYREVLPLRDTHLISQAIEKMYNLRTLIIICPYSIGDLYYLPDGLRYLHWHMYPMEVLPLSFNPMNLVELDLSYSKIKQLWEVKKPVQNLKMLNLSFCENLIRIPDLSDIPSAESIHLQFCSSLIEIHSSRGCPKLKQLDLSCCQNLIRIPDLSDIPSAESIELKLCSSLIEIHSSRGCPKLKQLDLSFCQNLIRIPDLSDIPSAESIDLKLCSSLIEIHSSGVCPKLKQLDLSSCQNLIRIPELSNIPSAESIHLQFCSSLIEIHSSRGCPKLKQLDLSCCQNLIRIPDLSDIPSAERLDLKFCSSLIEIHSSRGCPKLKQLDLSFCQNLIRIPDLSDIPSTESIDLKLCSSLIEIHSLGVCPKLKQLDLSSCRNLIRIPNLSDIPSAESINLKFCSSLTEIHSSRGCPKLKQLDLSYCKNLIRIPDLSDIPSAESIDLQFCSSLREIHSSRECPKNLHSLNLSECKNLSRLPSNIHIEGSEFNLIKCINLTKLPHISGNIKRLELSYSGVEEVPSTIQSLSKLESLDMDGCESLKRISKGICKLKSLDWLEELDFTGCKNLERLPKSIKKLSKLYSLKLNDCGMLRSLPELPSSLRHLKAINCKQLIQSLPDEFEFEQAISFKQLIQYSSLYFNFINCLKMSQEAVSNLLIFFRDSLRKMQPRGTETIIFLFGQHRRKEVEGSICLPGSEIPEWFCYKNNGSSINIPGLRNDCGRSRYIMGFAVCLVIGFDNFDQDYDVDFHQGGLKVNYDFHIETRDGHKERFFHKLHAFDMEIEKDEFSYSDHIFLGYNLSSECYKLFQKLDTLLANRGMSDYVGTSIEFNVLFADEKATKSCKVKYCGIQPIYVQAQVINSVAINQDTGVPNGCNDTAEETCEPHPKRICTEAKQCSLLRITSIIQDTVGL